jgi:histone H3/H4
MILISNILLFPSFFPPFLRKLIQSHLAQSLRSYEVHSDIPKDVKVSKEALALMQVVVSEFIGFITSDASELVQVDKRKTITGTEILQSLGSFGFDGYLRSLQTYLNMFRIKMRQSSKDGDNSTDADSLPGGSSASISHSARGAEENTATKKRGRKARLPDPVAPAAPFNNYPYYNEN